MRQMFVNKILCANMHTLTLGSWGGRKGAAFYDAAKKDYLMSISASKQRALCSACEESRFIRTWRFLSRRAQGVPQLHSKLLARVPPWEEAKRSHFNDAQTNYLMTISAS